MTKKLRLWIVIIGSLSTTAYLFATVPETRFEIGGAIGRLTSPSGPKAAPRSCGCSIARSH